jgi:CVNH domain
MPIRISSSRALFSLAAAVLLWLTFGGLSLATATCPFGADKNGTCLCPPGTPTGTKCGGPPAGGGGGCSADPPRGSYLRSCDRINFKCSLNSGTEETLSAWCKPRQGPEQFTQIGGPGACVGDIANMNGVLHCSKGGSPPGGSYTQSCQDIYVDSGVLHAQCKTRNGQWNQSEGLTYAPCRNGVENIDGHLRCR